MNSHYDRLETRDAELREREQMTLLRAQIAHAKAHSPAFGRILQDVDPEAIDDRGALAWCGGGVVGDARLDAGGQLPPDGLPLGADAAHDIGSRLGIDWTAVDLEQFRRGLEVELEHGASDPETNVTDDDIVMTGKIAWAHLKEFPDYYTRLSAMEKEADEYWANK